jgi:hypothetical protein
LTSEKERREQKQREEQKKRSLHRKHKERRKRDLMPHLPFIIGFQGDPARDFRCEDVHSDSKDQIHTWILNPIHGWGERGLRRLSRYFSNHITRLHMGQILIYKAGDEDKDKWILRLGIGLILFGSITIAVCCYWLSKITHP